MKRTLILLITLNTYGLFHASETKTVREQADALYREEIIASFDILTHLKEGDS